MSETQPTENLEEAFSSLFASNVSGSGEEELLRTATTFALQFSAQQIKCIIYLKDLIVILNHKAEREEVPSIKGRMELASKRLQSFVNNYLEYKKNHVSDVFALKALEMISLRKYLNESSFKINVDK